MEFKHHTIADQFQIFQGSTFSSHKEKATEEILQTKEMKSKKQPDKEQRVFTLDRAQHEKSNEVR